MVALGSVCPFSQALDLGSKGQKVPMIPVAFLILMMLGTKHRSDPALPCPALPWGSKYNLVLLPSGTMQFRV